MKEERQTYPIVSICCMAYNHAPYLRKCFEGFLMQEPPTGVSADDPWYEILIHDDCSTDGTTEIIKEYAAKYPDKIFPLYEEENQYSKGKVIDAYNYNRAKGRYIAVCEGDDYWTDPCKIRKQVDFMESHPDYSVCTHGCTIYDTRSETQILSMDFAAYEKAVSKTKDGLTFNISDFFEGHYFQPLTSLFRVSVYDQKWCEIYRYYRDTHEMYHLLRAGKGYWMNFDGGVHIKHGRGVSSSIGTNRERSLEEREHVSELYLHNRRDMDLRMYLEKILLWNYDVYKREEKIQEFNIIMKPYWKSSPILAIRVYCTILKRKINGAIH